MKKKIVFVVAALVAFFSVWITVRYDVDIGIQNKSSDTSGKLELNQSSMSKPATVTQSAKIPQKKIHEFLEKYNKARSYRAFLHDIIREPDKGGLAYAFAVLSKCKQVANLTEKQNGMEEVKVRALTTLASRCDMSKAELDDASRSLAYARNLNISTDPVLKLPLALADAKTLGDKSAAVSAILQSGDPFIMRSILTPETVVDPQGENQQRIYFQNQWYQGTQDIGVINSAFDLAMCQMGVDCGADSTAALTLCLEKGWCGDSVQGAAQLQLNKESPGSYDQVSAIASQIIQQINSGNVAAFIHN